MADIKADAPYIGELGDYVKNSVHPAIGRAAGEGYGYGCDKSGFTGLLKPLQKGMDLLHEVSWDAGQLMQRKMQGTYQGLYATANSYAGMDNNNARNLKNLTGSAQDGLGGTFGRFRPAATFSDGEAGKDGAGGSVDPVPPVVGKQNLGDVMNADAWGVNAVNWFYKNFMSRNGKDLYDELLSPITGDFNRIRANGDAWKHASYMFWQTSANLSNNAKKLTESHWSEGKASNAFSNHIDLVWTPMLWIAKESCMWMGKGFHTLADESIRLAKRCAEILQQALERLLRLAATKLNSVGFVSSQAAETVEWLATKYWHPGENKPFPIPLWNDVKAIWNMFNNVKTLYEAIQQMVTAAQEYYKGIQQVLDTAKQIPDIDSTHDAATVAQGLGSGGHQMRQAKQNFDEAQKSYQNQIDGLKRTAAK